MNGLVLNQKSVVLAMDDTLSGESIPVKALAKGYLKDQGAMVPQWDLLFDDSGKAVEELFDKNSQENIIDAYQLQLVTGKVLDKIREMADRLFAGEIAPSPVETQSGKACNGATTPPFAGPRTGRCAATRERATSRCFRS